MFRNLSAFTQNSREVYSKFAQNFPHIYSKYSHNLHEVLLNVIRNFTERKKTGDFLSPLKYAQGLEILNISL